MILIPFWPCSFLFLVKKLDNAMDSFNFIVRELVSFLNFDMNGVNKQAERTGIVISFKRSVFLDLGFFFILDCKHRAKRSN